MSTRILIGDCREILPTLPDRSVHCCVTSPPYFGLRSYLPSDHPDKAKEIGLEKTPDEYVATMVAVFREVRRVLRDDGTCWLNLGDSYARNPTKGQHKPGDAGKQTYLIENGGGIASNQSIPVGLKEKDMIGIPWRVAFALQAPDYLGKIRNETDRAWMAGLVDGEGCITILEAKSGHDSGSSYPPILQVRMCDRECIDHAMRITDTGGDSPAQYPASMEGQRPAYQWRIHGRKAADIIAEIYPFLLIKRKQAIVAWNHQAVRDSYETKRGVKIPGAALEKQRLCREIIQKLNQREPVDLPSWMIEPPLPIGPGWFLRQDLIWSKPNPMPESVTDRCTKAHEYLFLLSKSARYFYDADAIAEPLAYGSAERLSQDVEGQEGSDRVPGKTNGKMKAVYKERYTGQSTKDYATGNAQDASATKQRIVDRILAGELVTRNKRSVWTVTTKPYKGAHFATFPPALIEPCIKAGCPVQCCAKCGAPWERKTERVDKGWDGSKYGERAVAASGGAVTGGTAKSTLGSSNGKSVGHRETIGFTPSCGCNADAVPGVCLDPFGGAGTTGLVADRLGRNAVLIELDSNNTAQTEQRIVSEAGLFAEIV